MIKLDTKEKYLKNTIFLTNERKRYMELRFKLMFLYEKHFHSKIYWDDLCNKFVIEQTNEYIHYSSLKSSINKIRVSRILARQLYRKIEVKPTYEKKIKI